MEQHSKDAVTPPVAPAAQLTSDAVAVYLRQHPDFLVRYPDIAPLLVPPTHRREEGVIDFGRLMIDRLRAEISSLKSGENGLLATVKSNRSGQERVHRAALKLLAADSAESFLRAIQVDLLALLEVQAATLCLTPEMAEMFATRERGCVPLNAGDMNRLLKAGREAALREAAPVDAAMFPGAGDTIRSVAVLRLVFGAGLASGLLALGSDRTDGFHLSQGTDLLVFLARVTELRLRQWLPTPR